MQTKLLLLLTVILLQLLILFGLWLHSRHINRLVADGKPTVPSQNFWLYKGKTTEVQKPSLAEQLQNFWLYNGKIREAQKAPSSCPETSPHLVGPLHVEFNYSRTMEDVRTNLSSTLLEGGRYKPPDCISHQRVSN